MATVQNFAALQAIMEGGMLSYDRELLDLTQSRQSNVGLAHALRKCIYKTCVSPADRDKYLKRLAETKKRSTAGHKCARNRAWEVDLLERMLTIVHDELANEVAHGRTPDLQALLMCDPNAIRQRSRQEVIDSFVTHWTSWMEAIQNHAIRLEANFAIAWFDMAIALSKFDKGRKKHGLCIEPLWQFLLQALQIMNDLGLAYRYDLDYKAVHKAPRRVLFGPKLGIDVNDLPLEDQTCPTCLERFSTAEEAETFTLLQELPFRQGAEEELPRQSHLNPYVADTPRKTTCGHIIGMSCMARYVYGIMCKKGTDRICTCPLCRMPLARGYMNAYHQLINLGREIGFRAPQ